MGYKVFHIKLLIFSAKTALSSCEANEFDNPNPLYTEPKTHAEEEEMVEDKQRKPK